jgi:hypothetical protein
MAPNQDDEFDRLKREIELTSNSAQNLTAAGQHATRLGQSTLDILAPLRSFMTAVPDPSMIQPMRLSATADALSQLRIDLTSATPSFSPSHLGVTSSAVGVTSFLFAASAGSGLMSPSGFLQPPPPPVAIPCHEAFKVFANTIQKGDLLKNATDALTQLGLDVSPPGRKSPLQLLNDAWNAFLTPPDTTTSPAGVLLFLKGCIEASLAALLLRRPNQEPAKKSHEKVRSILNQTLRPGTPLGVAIQLESQVEQVLNDLSKSKESDQSRDEVNSVLIQATIFLVAFLNAIDPARLR